MTVQAMPAATSGLDRIIPPEILNDSFYSALSQMASDGNLKTYLEIGSSSGGGSTNAFVSAIRQRPDRDSVKLFCMEVSQTRFSALKEFYRNDDFVHCYNVSSVALEEFPSVAEVTHFYNNTRTNLNQYPLEVVLGWLEQDLAYVRSAGLTFNGIQHIKRENQIDQFDMVLIDGSEFTGERELYSVMGSKIIALDDVNIHKCFNCYRILSNHVSYALLQQDFSLRNGFAVFARRY